MEEKEIKKTGKRRTHAKRVKRGLADTTSRHLEQLTKKARALAGAYEPEDISSEAISGRVASLHQRHSQLKERLARYFPCFEASLYQRHLKWPSGTEKLLNARLRQEFEDAQADGTSVCDLDSEAWNDGIIAALREQVHGELEMSGQENASDFRKTLYKVEGKIICGLKGGRIGIQYDTSFAGEQFETYYLVLASRSFLEKMFVSEHTIPFFLPLQETERSHLSSSAAKFIDYIGELVLGYVSRREQIRTFKELNANKITHISQSLPCNAAEFMVEEDNCKVTVSLAYEVLSSDLPTQTKVLAWPHSSLKGMNGLVGGRASKPRAIPYSLAYAEGSLKRNPLPHAYEDVVHDLKTTLGQISPTLGAMPVAPEEK